MFSSNEIHASKTEKVVINYPVPDLLKYLPHRDPMVWVDEVIEMGMIEKTFYGVCRTEIKTLGLLFSDGHIRGANAVELCAQTYGFAKACFHHVNHIDDTPSVTYLTGVRECRANFEALPKNNEQFLRTEVKTLRRMENLTFLEGKVLGGTSGTLYAAVTLQVYTA